MLLNAVVLSGDVNERGYYNQLTGALEPGYAVTLSVIDADTDEKLTVQLTDGFVELEHLKQLRKQNAAVEDMRAVAEQLRAALPPKFSTLPLEVLRLKGKSAQYITLVCRFAHTAAAAAA